MTEGINRKAQGLCPSHKRFPGNVVILRYHNRRLGVGARRCAFKKYTTGLQGVKLINADDNFKVFSSALKNIFG